MADVTLTYKGSDILELSDSGSATLKTGGKYCEDDVTVEYVKPSGGGGSYIDLSDPSLWESKDFTSAVDAGSSYSETKTDTTTRISLKQPIEISDETVFIRDGRAHAYLLLFDENKNYIGWCSNGWIDSAVFAISKESFVKRNGNESLSSARYVGLAIRLNDTNPTITTDVAQTINARVLSAEVT